MDVTGNSMDAVSDRDYIVEFLFCASLMATHLRFVPINYIKIKLFTVFNSNTKSILFVSVEDSIVSIFRI